MRITIHGSYGTGNRGDNVILIQLLRFLEEECPGASVTVLCRNERRLALLLDAEFSHSSLDIRPLPASFKRRPVELLEACTRCDLFILGGGGLLWGRAWGNLSYWLLRPRLAHMAGRRLVFYVPGIYGIKGAWARRLLRTMARRADFLSVRDDEGLKQLIRAGIPASRVVEGADPAFLMPPPEAGRIESLVQALGLEDRMLVGLSARDWRGRLSAGLFANFVQQLLANEDCILLFFAFNTNSLPSEVDRDDLSVAKALLRTLPEEMQGRLIVVDENYSLDELLALIGACDYLIGMRLHALIFATIAGVPFGAIAYDEKISAYMHMLGRDAFLLGLEEAADPQQLKTLAERLHEERMLSDVQGPLPAILHSAAQLSVRSLTMHRALAARLQSWFPRGPQGKPRP